MSQGYDLLIRAGRIVCPATGADFRGAVAVREGRIAAVGPDLSGPAGQVWEFPDSVLLPGLIDLHGHPSRSPSKFGLEPDEHFLARGTTAVLAQGEVGAAGCDEYVRGTIEGSATRIRLAINLSSIGETGTEAGFARLEYADVKGCVAAVNRHPDQVWGIAVNASHQSCGATDPREVLSRGLRAAEESGRPILYGLRRPEDWPLEEQLALMRPGDVVTYLYRRTPHCLLEGKRIRACFRRARERGIRFDLGHGLASFDFEVAEIALGEGFPPDTLSTDLQRGHLGREPVHDLPLVMSKLRAAGMPKGDIFSAVTAAPAEILGWGHQAGALRVGFPADLVLLRWDEEPGMLHDAVGQSRPGGRWQTAAVFRAGESVAGA